MRDDDTYDDDADAYGADAYDDDAVGREEYRDDVYDEEGSAYYEDDEYETEYGRDAEADDGSWWDEALVAGLLIVGVFLFLFPEPFTSTIGIILIVIGVLAWVADALT